MKLWMPVLAVVALLITTGARAQGEGTQPPAVPDNGAISGATIPIMRTPGPDSGAAGAGSNRPSDSGVATPQTPGLIVTRPVPESAIQPNTIQHAPTASEIAADQAIRKQADEDVTGYAERVSDTCDASFKARIDWTQISPLQTHRYSPADACGAALQAIEEACGNPVAKARIAKQVKSLICTTGPTPGVEMHGGTLVYVIDWQSVNPGERVYTWLATHL